MKKLLFFVIIPIVFINISCNNNSTNNNSVHISGVLDKEKFYDNFTLNKTDIIADEGEVYLVNLDSNNYFEYTLNLDFPQYIYLMGNNHYGFSIMGFPGENITINTKDSISVEYMKPENQELNKALNLFNSKLRIIHRYHLNGMIYKDISEKDLTQRLDSSRNALINEFLLSRNSQNFSEQTKKIIRNEINFFSTNMLSNYVFLNKIIFNQKREIPNLYYSLMDTIVEEFDNNIFPLYATSFFNTTFGNYYSTNRKETIDKINQLKPSAIRDIFLLRYIDVKIDLYEFSEAKLLMNEFLPHISNKKMKNQIENHYYTTYENYRNPDLTAARLKKLSSKSGILNEIIKSHPNKVLYLKFWAPYCGPCIEQSPFAKKIEDKFDSNNFKVISISEPYNEDIWKASIKKHNMSGVQYLLTEQQYNELKSTFNISGIPRYFIINKKGEIVDDNAPIPGNNFMGGVNYNLVQMIEELLNEN